MATDSPPILDIDIDGATLPDDVATKLTNLRVRTSVHEAGRVELRFDDDDRRLLDRGLASVGDPVTIAFIDGTTGRRHDAFSGQITSIGSLQSAPGRTPELEIVAQDASHRLQAASEFTSYLNQSPKDVVTAIAKRHGLEATVEAADAAIPYLVQSETDHAFVSRLATMLGHEWFTEGTTLHFRPRPPLAEAPKLAYGGNLDRFEARYSGHTVPSQVTVHSWDPAQQQRIAGSSDDVTASPGIDDLGSDAPLVTQAHEAAVGTFGRTLTVAGTAARDGTEADDLAASIARRLLADGLYATGVASGALSLRAGRFVEVAEVGTALSGHYYATEVEHTYGADQHLSTRFVAGGHRLEESLGTGHGHGHGTLDGWGSRGLLIGVVTNVNDPEQLGRVKLRFPSLGDEVESDWARVAVAGAGKERGLHLTPEVDDEVVVGFERGDPRMPFVLGGLHHAEAKPVGDLLDRGSVIRRTLRSRLGHEIALVDGTNASDHRVEITVANTGAKVIIGEEEILIEAEQNTPIALRTSKASMTLTDDGKFVVKAAEISLSSDGDVSVKANGAANLKATQGATVDGGQQAEVKGVQAKLTGQATATIKGGMVKIN